MSQGVTVQPGQHPAPWPVLKGPRTQILWWPTSAPGFRIVRVGHMEVVRRSGSRISYLAN